MCSLAVQGMPKKKKKKIGSTITDSTVAIFVRLLIITSVQSGIVLETMVQIHGQAAYVTPRFLSSSIS